MQKLTMDQQTPPIETSLKSLYRWSAIIVIGFIGSFLVWSIVTKLASGVIAAGSVKVDSNRKQIQHLEGGIVSEILVRDGDTVKADQVLVRLDDTRAATSLALVQQNLDSAQIQAARMLAEQNDLEAMQLPGTVVDRQEDPKIKEMIQAQQQLFTARKESLNGQVKILDQQIRNYGQQIKGFVSQQHSKELQLSSIRQELEDLRKLFEKGMIDRTRLLMLERNEAELVGEVGELVSKIASARTTIGETKLEKFQLDKAFKENVSTDLKEIQVQVNDYQERLLAARHVFAQTQLKSPVDGIVVQSDVHTVSGVVSPGSVLMEIVPINDHLIIEVSVDPQDIDRVKLGLEAGIKFSAFNQREVPEILGTVTYVAADSIKDDTTGMSFYKARVEVEERQIQRLGEREIQPGMVADVVIRTGSRTPMDYILEPLISSFRKAWREA